MHFSGDHGIGEIVGIAVAASPKIKPSVRILMDEKRGPGADIPYAVVFKSRPGPRRPSRCGQSVSFGAQTQKINHHVLAVTVPAGFNEAVLRGPAHRKSAVALQHPKPIDALENGGGQLVYLSVVKIGAASEHAAKKDGGVDGGHF